MTDTKRSSGTKLSGTLLLASGIVFFIFNTIAEGIYPNYSVGVNALSDLGALGEPTRFLWNGQLLVSGITAFLGMYVLFYRSNWAVKVKKRNLIAIIFLLPYIGAVLVALFPENFIGSVHAVGAFLAFIFGAISAIYAYRITTRPFRYFSLILGVISLIMIFLLEERGSVDFGLIERLVVYPFVIWGISFGGYLMGHESSS